MSEEDTIVRHPLKDDETVRIEIDSQRKMLSITSSKEDKRTSDVIVENNKEVLLQLWREARTVINHFDQLMDNLRMRALTIFGTVTSIAVVAHYWLHDNLFFGFRISALIECIILFLLILIFIQNVCYHKWLYKSVNIALNIENQLYRMGFKLDIDKLFITSSLTGLREPRKTGFWRSMVRSKLARLDVIIYLAVAIPTVVLTYIFLIT
jgi:hypothetical protein